MSEHTHFTLMVDKADADAKLNAAAPDLLAALKVALKHFRHPTSADAETRAIIVAAIAKAEGRA